ncbi:hypothetical protein AAC387_Pa06g1128 [Persea americana]
MPPKPLRSPSSPGPASQRPSAFSSGTRASVRRDTRGCSTSYSASPPLSEPRFYSPATNGSSPSASVWGPSAAFWSRSAPGMFSNQWQPGEEIRHNRLIIIIIIIFIICWYF